MLRRIPAPPRCKLCFAPFGRPGGPVMRLLGRGPSRLNPRICRWCIGELDRSPGGTEVDVSLLFADVRGSTALAERIPAREFSQLLARFYGVGARVVDRWDGIVDKFVGDELVALLLGFAGDDHAADAGGAARELLRETGNDGDEPWVPLGVGVHSGVSFVGSVGEGDALDFTAVGDPVNVAARVSAAAGAGELLLSAAAADAAAIETSGLERRSLAVRGRDAPVDVRVARG